MSKPAARRRAIGIAAIALLGYGGLAIGSGLDRLTQRTPQAASLVPGPFAARALRTRAGQALEKGDAQAALGSAVAAVNMAPLDPGSTALLGAARLKSGDAAGAERAFRIAGQLGWRDPYTQAYWMERALRIGDYRVAAMRLDALLRQRPDLLGERRLMDPLEGTQLGRAALAERILGNPNWLEAYVAKLDGVPRPVLSLRTQVLAEVAARNAVLGCEPIGPLIERLVLEAAEMEAAALWRQHCPGAGQAIVYDGNFAKARIDQVRSQFAWSFIGQADTNILFSPGPKANGQWVEIDTTSRRIRQFMRQMVLAAPGSYQLSWIALDDTDKPSALVVASLTCSMDPRDWAEARYDPATKRWVSDFTIDRSCQTWWLNFGVSGTPGKARMSEVTLRPIDRPAPRPD